MDLPSSANFAEAFAVIVAVVFGMVQLRRLNAPRRREAAFALMHSIQSPQMLRGNLIIDRLQGAPAKAGIDALPENDQVDGTALLATWESLGIPVFHHEIRLQMVDDFYSGTLQQSWRKLQRYIKELREATARPTWEWLQWLAERMQKRESDAPPCPGLRSASQMDATSLSLSGRS